jgi:hypothetical protein
MTMNKQGMPVLILPIFVSGLIHIREANEEIYFQVAFKFPQKYVLVVNIYLSVTTVTNNTYTYKNLG